MLILELRVLYRDSFVLVLIPLTQSLSRSETPSSTFQAKRTNSIFSLAISQFIKMSFSSMNEWRENPHKRITTKTEDLLERKMSKGDTNSSQQFYSWTSILMTFYTKTCFNLPLKPDLNLHICR